MRRTLYGSVVFLMVGAAQTAAAASASYVIANNTPRFVAAGQKLSGVDPSSKIEVTVWLMPHNKPALDAMVAKMYEHASPQYHQWLSRDALQRMIAPSTSEVAEVTRFLQASSLAVTAKDKFGLFVRARGTVAAVQKAFNVTLSNVTFKGRTYRANLTDPSIADPAGAHVMAVEGLDNVAFEHHYIAQSGAIKNLAKATKGTEGTAAAAVPSAAPCITGTGTDIFTTGGTLPYGVFKGNLFTKSATGCGFTPPEIQAAYGLTALYAAGYNGAGQTIMILDWCGSPTITADANAFSARYGLPALTSANFQIVDYPGSSSCAAPDPEINIDVEWSHAIAPGANIVLVVPPSASFSDVDAGLLYEVENPIGNISSNSWGSEELYTPIAVLELQNFIMETAASVGIAMNFSSGDDGDLTFDFPEYNPPSVLSPADSPYVTAVGGISLQLTRANAIQWQAAWGTNETLISEPGFVPVPAFNFGFDFGSGGGPSAVFPKLSYQAALPGTYRQVPDVSWLADPFTGGYIAITEPFTSPAITYQVYGGTSLACPMFAGLWAIADQVAGSSLGQAAPLLYAAPASTFTDIVPYGSKTNVTALYQTSTGNLHEPANALVQPLETTTTYVSAIWDYPDNQDVAYILTFGTDSGLVAAPGWDPATGLGVTKPAALIGYVSGLTTSARK